MSHTTSLPALQQALGLSMNEVLNAIVEANVSVFLPLPEGERLLIEFELDKVIKTVPPNSQTIDLSPFDFVRLEASSVHDVAHRLDKLGAEIGSLVSVDRDTGTLIDHAIEDQLSQSPWKIAAASGFGRRTLTPALAEPLLQCGCIKLTDKDTIVECLNYHPRSQDLGDFKPSDATTPAIQDINIAFQIFRVKKPLDSHAPSRCAEWFRHRWNTPSRTKQRGRNSPLGADVLQKAAEVVLNANPKISTGDLSIPDAVRERHHAQAPDALMLAEYLAQWRESQERGAPSSQGDLDFRRNENLLGTLKERGVAPSKYRDLLVRLLTM